MSRKYVFNAYLTQPSIYCVNTSQPIILTPQQAALQVPSSQYLQHSTRHISTRTNNLSSQLCSPIPNSTRDIANTSSFQVDKSGNQYHTASSHRSIMGNRFEKSNRIKFDSKEVKHKERKRPRPWRGYILEGEEEERHFQSVALNDYYVKEAISDAVAAITISSATEKLKRLHRKFGEHRKTIDDGRPLESRKIIDPLIPFNDNIEDNGICQCSDEQKKTGIHHDIYPAQTTPRCDKFSNNANVLYHYRLVITPETNFVTRDPTTIYYDGKDFCFEGYSVFSHNPIDDIPPYSFSRFLIDYEVKFIRVDYIPEGFCIKDLDLVSDYLFEDIMELHEWKTRMKKDSCRQFHFMPRFVHRTTDLTVDGKRELSEILSMGEVLQYLLESCSPFADRHLMNNFAEEDWEDFSKEKHGSLICNCGKKPRLIRVDDVKPSGTKDSQSYPEVIHLTPEYSHDRHMDMKVYGDLSSKLMKVKKAIRSRAVPRKEDQNLFINLSEELQKFKQMRRETKWVDVSFSSRKYLNTGLRWDICQHASYLPALSKYLRIMLSTSILEKNINYTFKDKSLLKTAITHPSHMDTASFSIFIWNMLQNLGKQYPRKERKDRKKKKTVGSKKKGIIYMTNVMAGMFNEEEITSSCHHNERLEFLGDALLDYIISLHLFSMFPQKGPGKLTDFRSGLVQTEHLSDVAKKIELEQYILVQHRVVEISKNESYLGNAVEAIVGAVYLDGGLCAVENLLSFLLFKDDMDLCKTWNNLKKHPLQEEHLTDRHLIRKYDMLKNFVKLEDIIGIEFKHIRLLAKAFTHNVQGLRDESLTGGNYERLEFLGDAILKYVSSDYLYKHFPMHQEGHLTLLRSTLVNYRCLAKAARELGLNNFIIFQSYRNSTLMNEKVCSDVFEALLGALHIDKGVTNGIKYCYKLVEVCILSRLQEFIMNQEWLDPKCQLLQCCHSLRDPTKQHKNGKDYFHPIYKKLESTANNGVHYFKVGVFVNEKLIGVGEGRSAKDAEKEAAKAALADNHFELCAIQKRIAYRKFGRLHPKKLEGDSQDDEDDAIKAKSNKLNSDEDDYNDDGYYNDSDKESDDCSKSKHNVAHSSCLSADSEQKSTFRNKSNKKRDREGSVDIQESSPWNFKRRKYELKELSSDHRIGDRIELEKWISDKCPSKDGECSDSCSSTFVPGSVSSLGYLERVEAISSPESVKDSVITSRKKTGKLEGAENGWMVEPISSTDEFEPISSPENSVSLTVEKIEKKENGVVENSSDEDEIENTESEESDSDSLCLEDEETFNNEKFIDVDVWEESSCISQSSETSQLNNVDSDDSLTEVKLY